jgi:ubiquinol-cytochrome c reductase cytochrome b subunit
MRFLDAIGDWIDDRTALRDSVREWLEFRSPRAGGWLAVFSAAVGTCVAVLALTGVLLMMAYAPSPQSAWASVHYLQFVQDHGWIVRGLHYWAAQTLVVLAAASLLFGALAATYRAPREIAWWMTLLVFALTLAEMITGGLLPWDQRGWWGRVVEANIIGLAPVLGSYLSKTISGGAELGAFGLARAYTAHVLLLPIPLVLALAVRSAIARRSGWVESSMSRETMSTFELWARGFLVMAIVVCALFTMTGFAHGAPLEAPADPLSDYPARPEWFLMPLFRLRKFFHGPMEFWGTTQLPGLVALYFVVLPWIDRRPFPHAIAVAPVVLVFAGAVTLGVMAARHDARDPAFVKSSAKWDARARAVQVLAMNGVPPDGILAMEHRDPELHGRDLFEAHCASCHVLEDMGDKEKASASQLDGWGTVSWIDAMVHDPDAPAFFGRGPYKEQMPSVDVRPKKKTDEPWTAMAKNDDERKAVAIFLAAQGAEPDDPPSPAPDAAALKIGEKIVSERCTTCHLYKGDGDDEGSGLAPELAAYGSLAWTRAQIENPSSPKVYREKALDADLKKHMPRFDKDLSPSDIDAVARFVRVHARAHAGAM